MLCTKYIIVFSLENSRRRHYTLPENTIGEQFPQETTYNMSCRLPHACMSLLMQN